MLRTFFLSFFFLSLISSSFASTSRNLTIFAESNMTLALTKIVRLYSQKSNTVISINFGPAQDMLSEIESGEPVDVFISAHPGWLDVLRQKGLTDIHNVGYVARDDLVLVTAKSNPALPQELRDQKLSLEESLKILNHNKINLITDNEGNSSGKFSRDLLKSFFLGNLKVFSKISEDKSPVISSIKTSDKHYAILLQSQIKNESDLMVLAAQNSENIFYQALVIAGDNMEIAREFLKFLKSDTAKAILRESGFIVD